MSNTSLSFTQLRRDAERAIQDKQWKEAHSLLTLARVMRPSHRNVARRLKAVEQPNQPAQATFAGFDVQGCEVRSHSCASCEPQDEP